MQPITVDFGCADSALPYPRHWEKFNQLAKHCAGAARLYAHLIQYTIPDTAGLLCDQALLAKQLQVAPRTIRRWVVALENQQVIRRVPVTGKVSAYIVDMDLPEHQALTKISMLREIKVENPVEKPVREELIAECRVIPEY